MPLHLIHYVERCNCIVNVNKLGFGVVCLQVQRLYGKYLRAESFRKALIYQKKYLLLLIGGFRDCEDETLAMIARMGAEPSPGDLAHRQLRPLSKFRSAARVIVAISRFLSVYTKFSLMDIRRLLLITCHFVLISSFVRHLIFYERVYVYPTLSPPGPGRLD